MTKKTDKNANIDPEVTVIGKGSPYVTKSKPFKINKEACKGKPFKKIVIEGIFELIEEETFRDCNNLVSVEIRHGITEIGEGAFRNCKKMISVVIPKSTKVEGKAF